MAGQDTNRQSWRQRVDEVQNPNKNKFLAKEFFML